MSPPFSLYSEGSENSLAASSDHSATSENEGRRLISSVGRGDGSKSSGRASDKQSPRRETSQAVTEEKAPAQAGAPPARGNRSKESAAGQGFWSWGGGGAGVGASKPDRSSSAKDGGGGVREVVLREDGMPDWGVLTDRAGGLAPETSSFELMCFIDNADTDTQVGVSVCSVVVVIVIYVCTVISTAIRFVFVRLRGVVL